MAKKKQTAKDLFMNYKVLRVKLNSSNATTLVEETFDTGLSAREGFCWLIHEVSFDAPHSYLYNFVHASLSVHKGLATIPDISDHGTYSFKKLGLVINSTGAAEINLPKKETWLPPIPMASPNLSLYAQAQSDDTGWRGEYVDCRIGYTTMPIDSDVHLELAEIWGS